MVPPIRIGTNVTYALRRSTSRPTSPSSPQRLREDKQGNEGAQGEGRTSAHAPLKVIQPSSASRIARQRALSKPTWGSVAISPRTSPTGVRCRCAAHSSFRFSPIDANVFCFGPTPPRGTQASPHRPKVPKPEAAVRVAAMARPSVLLGSFRTSDWASDVLRTPFFGISATLKDPC